MLQLVRATDRQAVTPMHLAAAGGFADVLRTLADRGADRSAADWLGRGPAEWARNHRQPAALAALQPNALRGTAGDDTAAP